MWDNTQSMADNLDIYTVPTDGRISPLSILPWQGGSKTFFLKHWNVLKSNPSLNFISSVPPLIAFKRNLRDRLVHSDTRKPPNTVYWLPHHPIGFFHCTQCSNSSDTSTLHIHVLVQNTP